MIYVIIYVSRAKLLTPDTALMEKSTAVELMGFAHRMDL